MSAGRWDRVTELFDLATAVDPAERAAFLARICPDEPDVRDEVLSLLSHDDLVPAEFLAPQVSAALCPHERPSDSTGEPSDPLIGQVIIGRYVVTRRIAEGGMGTVYEATQARPHRTVALKILHGLGWSPSVRRRFDFECQALARLSHPNIAQLYEAGIFNDGRTRDGAPFFAMEYIVDAYSITEFARRKQWEVRQRLRLFLSVCDAVQYGHQQGLIHRDLKPANLLVDAHARVKIIDFGVARATDADVAVTTMHTDLGQLVGTLQYMSPEQCEGDPHRIDARTDVYSAGVVLYELLTGRLPYDLAFTSVYQATRAIREESPKRPSTVSPMLRGDIEAIVLKALEKERERRYQSVAELAADIRRYLNHEPILARRPSTLYQLRLFSRRHRALSAGILASTVMLVVGSMVSTLFAVRASREWARAEYRTYALDLAAAEAAMQRYDVADANARLNRAARSELGCEGKAWEIRHLRSRLDHSLATIETGYRHGLGAMIDTSGELVAAIGFADQTGHGLRIWKFVDTGGFPSGSPGTCAELPPNAPPWLRAAAFSVDGSLTTSSYDPCFLTRWSLDPGGLKALAEPVQCMGRGYHAIAVSGDGQFLAGGSVGGPIELWQLLRDGHIRRIGLLTGHTDVVNAVAFSPNGKLLASGSEDFTVRLWDVDLTKSGQPAAVGVLHGHGYKVMGVAFDSTGTVVASASMDGTVKLWDVLAGLAEHAALPAGEREEAQGVELDTLFGYREGVLSVAFQPNGNLLAMGCADNTVRLWELAKDRAVGTLPFRRPRWHAPENRQLAVLRGHTHRVVSVAFSPDGGWLLSGSDDSTVRVWGAGGVPDVPSLVGHKSSVSALSFHPTGRWLASGAGDGTVRLWDTRLVEGVATRSGFQTSTRALKFSPDGRRLLVSDDDGVVAILAVHVGEGIDLGHMTALGTGLGPASAAVFSNDGRRLAVCSRVGRVCVWDAADKEGHRKILDESMATVSGVAFLDDTGTRLAIGTGDSRVAPKPGSVEVWDLDARRRIHEFARPHGFDALAVSRDHHWLAAAGGDNSIWIFELGSRVPSLRRTLTGHSDRIWALAFHPDGRRLASGSADRTARLWDVEVGQELLVLLDQPGSVVALEFSPDGQSLATASSGLYGRDNVIRLWETNVDPRTRWDRIQADNARRRAEPIVETLFADYIVLEDVLSQIEHHPALQGPIREAAVRLARSRGELATVAFGRAWQTSRDPGREFGKYSHALQEAEHMLARVAPKATDRPRLLMARAMALYRLERLGEAADAIQDSEAAFAECPTPPPGRAVASVVQAMVLAQIGQTGAAEAKLAEARASAAAKPDEMVSDLETLLNEAESLLRR